MKRLSIAEQKLTTIKDISKGFVTVAEMDEAGIRKDEIHRLCKKGKLKRIRKSFYLVKSEKLDKRKLITTLVPDAIFCLRSSLSYYELNRKGEFFDVAVSWDVSQSKIEMLPELKINFFRYPKQCMNIGLTEIDGYRYYNYERTVCDAFLYYKKLGFGEKWCRDIAREFNKERTIERLENLDMYYRQLGIDEETKNKIDEYILNKPNNRDLIGRFDSRTQRSRKKRTYKSFKKNHKVVASVSTDSDLPFDWDPSFNSFRNISSLNRKKSRTSYERYNYEPIDTD